MFVLVLESAIIVYMFIFLHILGAYTVTSVCWKQVIPIRDPLHNHLAKYEIGSH